MVGERVEIAFIVARNVAKGFIPAKYSEAMVSFKIKRDVPLSPS
jgi:hypothetical protein